MAGIIPINYTMTEFKRVSDLKWVRKTSDNVGSACEGRFVDTIVLESDAIVLQRTSKIGVSNLIENFTVKVPLEKFLAGPLDMYHPGSTYNHAVEWYRLNIGACDQAVLLAESKKFGSSASQGR